MRRERAALRLAWMFLACLLAGSPLAIAEDGAFDFSKLLDLKKSQADVKPIVVPKRVTTWRDVDKNNLAWYRRVLVEPFHQRVKEGSPDAAAKDFVDQAIALLAKSEPSPEKPTKLADEGRKLLTQGCEDPLVLVLAATLDFSVHDDWRTAAQPCMTAFQKALADRKSYRGLLSFIAAKHTKIQWRRGVRPVALEKQASTLFAEELADGSLYNDKEAMILVYHQAQGVMPSMPVEKLRQANLTPYLPEWARHTLLGLAEQRAAWEARGGGWASKVTEKGWKGFAEHLKKAREEYTQAWKLEPNCPVAPCQMIGVVMGEGESKDNTMRLWFDRTIDAQFDYLPAYLQMLWAYRPRWYGSHEQMLAFGKACLATRRFDTEVPTCFFRACNDIASELKDQREFFRRPEVAEPLLELSKALVEEPSRQSERPFRESMLAVNAWLAGDYPLAAKTLAALHGKLHPAAIKKIDLYHGDPEIFRAEIALYSSKGRVDFDNAESLYQSGDLAAAKDAYEKVGNEMGPEVKQIIEGRLALVHFEQELAKGKWVPITPAPLHTLWDIRQGQWSTDQAGNLVNRGADSQALILYRGRIGSNFEMRSDIDLVARMNCCRTAGIVFNWRPANSQFGPGILAIVEQIAKSNSYGFLWDNAEVWESPHLKIFKLGSTNHFYLCCRNDRVTFSVNYHSIFEDYPLKKDILKVADSGLVGFGGIRLCRNNTLTIRHIEVRGLPAEEPVDVPDLQFSAKTHWMSLAKESKTKQPNLALQLTLKGKSLDQASAYGDIEFSDVQDENGRALLVIGPGVTRRGKHCKWQMVRIPRETSNALRNGLRIPLTVKSPGAIQKIAKLQGSLSLRVGGSYQQLTLPHVSTQSDQPIDEDAAKSLGIVVRINPKMASSAKHLTVEAQWDRHVVTGCEILDSQGRLLKPTALTVCTPNVPPNVNALENKLTFVFSFPEKLPETIQLRLTVHKDPQKAKANFFLDNIQVPNMPAEPVEGPTDDKKKSDKRPAEPGLGTEAGKETPSGFRRDV